MNNPTNSVIARSAFVTGLAWSFIVLAGFATVISVLQNIMIALMFPPEEMRAALGESETTQPMPAMFRFMFEYFQYVVAGFLLLSVGTLISAIGLLRRKNWARRIFVVIMALGVVWNLASLAMPFLMSSMMSEMPAPPHSDFHDNFKLMWNIMVGFTVVMCLAFAALFAWIIKRLLAADIRREFVGTS